MAHAVEPLHSILREPEPAIRYAASLEIARARPGKHVLESDERLFDPSLHARAGLATLTPRDGVHAGWNHAFRDAGEPIASRVSTGWVDVAWRERSLEVVRLAWTSAYGSQIVHLVVADDRELAERYFDEVCTHNAEVRGEVLVFAHGCWNKSRELYDALRGAALSQVVLAPGLADAIRDDFDRFLAARDAYARWGVPWKRGALFVGPPGNGKTLCIKALLAHLGLPCLYVQSFDAPQRPQQVGIQEVFARARRTAPCVLVLEDLDTLVSPDARSFFLNELDGFASNQGLITIGTTNHPERLDPAIVDRPSRFDRKYHFELPGEPERARYLALWNERVSADLRLAPDVIAEIAAATDRFSFAYLKELSAASLMRFASEPGRALHEVVRQELEALRAQMQTTSLVPDPAPAIGPIEDPRHAWQRRYLGR